MSTFCQPGRGVIRVSLTLIFLYISENKKGFSTSNKAQISSPENTFYLHGRRENRHFDLNIFDLEQLSVFFQLGKIVKTLANQVPDST